MFLINPLSFFFLYICQSVIRKLSHQKRDRGEANNQVLLLGIARFETHQPEQSPKSKLKRSQRFFTCNWVAATSRNNSFCEQYRRNHQYQYHSSATRTDTCAPSSSQPISLSRNYSQKLNEIGQRKSKDVVGVSVATTANDTKIKNDWNIGSHSGQQPPIVCQPKSLPFNQSTLILNKKYYYDSDRCSTATLAQQPAACINTSITNINADQSDTTDRYLGTSTSIAAYTNNWTQRSSLRSNVHSPKDYLRNSQKKLAKKSKSIKRTSVGGCLPRCTTRNDSCEPESIAPSLKSSFRNNNNNDPANGHLNCRHRHSKQSLMNNWCNVHDMDRSVDSIGSCSLDVDAESTDFSGRVCSQQNNICVYVSASVCVCV